MLCEEDGMDELSRTSPSVVVEVFEGSRAQYRLDPQSLGLRRSDMNELWGGDRAADAELIRRVRAGERGARRDVVVLNAVAALRAVGVAVDWIDGIPRAADAIDSGRTAHVLERSARVSHAKPVVASAVTQ